MMDPQTEAYLCLATCKLKEVCRLEGCRKQFAASQVKDTRTRQFVHGASHVINRMIKTRGVQGMMKAIPSRRRQRRSALARANKQTE